MRTNKIISLLALTVIGLGGILFLLTTSFYKQPRGMEITFPAPDHHEGIYSMGCMRNEITIILSKDKRIFWYEGRFSDFNEISTIAFVPPSFKKDTPIHHEGEIIIHGEKIILHETKLSFENGICDVLSEHNRQAELALNELEKDYKIENMPDSTYQKRKKSINLRSSAVTVFIKTDNSPKYGEVVELIDLLKLKKISKFHLEEITKQELKLVSGALNKTPK